METEQGMDTEEAVQSRVEDSDEDESDDESEDGDGDGDVSKPSAKAILEVTTMVNLK